MSTGKHQSKSSIDKLDAKTVKLIVIAAAVLVIAAIVIVAVVLINSGGDDVPLPSESGDSADPGKEPSDSGDVTDKPSPATSEEPTETDEPTEPTDPTDSTEPTEPEPQFRNPLTGLASSIDLTRTRPFAIMFNNIRIATPQTGISAADMIFEVPVEGGITRLLAIFQDFDGAAAALGSIRSARPYFVDLAMGFDAIYIHAGGSAEAYVTIAETGITHIDAITASGDIFYRDQDRLHNMGYEHSLMLNVSAINAFVERYGFRTTHSDGYSAGFSFSDDVTRTGNACLNAEAVFNSAKSTSFAYDTETGLYNVSQFGGPMNDMATGDQLAVRNVILLSVRITNIAGDDAGRLQATLSGNGSGWFISDGTAERITWTRATPTSQFVFTDSDGNEIVLSPGSTYIGLVPLYGSINIK